MTKTAQPTLAPVAIDGTGFDASTALTVASTAAVAAGPLRAA